MLPVSLTYQKLKDLIADLDANHPHFNFHIKNLQGAILFMSEMTPKQQQELNMQLFLLEHSHGRR